VERLSDREFEIFELLGRGQDSHQIAKQLYLSSKTVDAHRGNMKKKFCLETSGELFRYAVRWVEANNSSGFENLMLVTLSFQTLAPVRARALRGLLRPSGRFSYAGRARFPMAGCLQRLNWTKRFPAGEILRRSHVTPCIEDAEPAEFML